MKREKQRKQTWGDETGDAPGKLEHREITGTQRIGAGIGSQRVGGWIVNHCRERIQAGNDKEKRDQDHAWHKQRQGKERET